MLNSPLDFSRLPFLSHSISVGVVIFGRENTQPSLLEQPRHQKRQSPIPEEMNCFVLPCLLASGATDLAPRQPAKGLDGFHPLWIGDRSLLLKFSTLSATDRRLTTKYLLEWAKKIHRI